MKTVYVISISKTIIDMLIKSERKSEKLNQTIRLVKSFGGTYSVHDHWNRMLLEQTSLFSGMQNEDTLAIKLFNSL